MRCNGVTHYRGCECHEMARDKEVEVLKSQVRSLEAACAGMREALEKLKPLEMCARAAHIVCEALASGQAESGRGGGGC